MDFTEITSWSIPEMPDVYKVIRDGVTIWMKEQPVSLGYFYIENAYDGENTVTVTNNSTSTATDLQYSLNGTDWTYIIITKSSKTITLSNQGDKVYFRGDNPDGFNDFGHDILFSASENHNVGGNISSLLNRDCNDVLTIPSSFCFYGLFIGDSKLVDASALVLPATTLTVKCYLDMFNGCTSLTTAPELPATTLADFCYHSMFQGCTSLTTAPSILPATTLAYECYRYMFRDCTSLTTAPELPATTLAEFCYDGMFQGCTNLNYIKVGTTSWNTSSASGWVKNVSATGDFYNLGGATIPTGTNGIPEGWTVHTTD